MEENEGIIGNSIDKDLYRQGYLSIFIEATDRCNMNCRYCYAKVNPNKEPTIDDFKKMISKCESIEGYDLFYELSGGELLLRQDWAEICELFLSTGKEVYFYSNVTLVDEKIAEEMKRLFDKFDGRLKILASLDSHIPEINNTTRDKYYETIKGLELLKEKGVKVKMNVVLNSQNISTIYDTFRFIAKNFSKEILLAVLRPTFNMIKQKHLLVPHEKIIEVSRNLTEMAKKESWNFFCSLDVSGKAYCKAAKDRIFINTEGDISPCGFLRHKKHMLGNIYTDSLKVIFEKMKEFNKNRDEGILLCEHLQEDFGEPSFRLGEK